MPKWSFTDNIKKQSLCTQPMNETKSKWSFKRQNQMKFQRQHQKANISYIGCVYNHCFNVLHYIIAAAQRSHTSWSFKEQNHRSNNIKKTNVPSYYWGINFSLDVFAAMKTVLFHNRSKNSITATTSKNQSSMVTK